MKRDDDVDTSPSARRREREREEMRDRLLRTARSIAAEQGWSAVTIRRIADRIEYTSPVIYHYFSSKDALVAEVMCAGFREIADRIADAAQGSADTRLIAVGAAFWDFAFAAPELYQAMNGQAGVSFAADDMPEEVEHSFRIFLGVLESIAAERGSRLADPVGAVNTVWAYLHGFVSLTMSGRAVGDVEQGKQLMLASLAPLFDAQLRPAAASARTSRAGARRRAAAAEVIRER
ncbi:TetR family transcriptional regulator [Nocardia tenerifensis]|uniref:TetR family transcriptional regulator n=1 Tax=Nocardia tenerifensis TaxID=228006 RepID=A0A318K2L7_9NOCA|nr:TetR/AcrR family transcriptional regulator [Nocardia tenerifensis]PXX55560.1 TetR family transcriptional regulator [Nocardia tenerifensis]